MVVKLVLKPEEIEPFRSKLKSLQLQLLSFEAITLRRLANEVVVDTIHEKMRAADPPFSEKIITGTTISNIEIKSSRVVRLFFVSEYFSETGFDVAFAREKGTPDHFIPPGPATSARPNPHLMWIQVGVPRFSKGHEVSGFPALKIIEETLDLKVFELQIKFEIELNNWIAKNIGGDVIGF